MFATFCTHMLGQGVFWLTRPQTNTPWLCQTLHLMLLLTTRLYINTTSTPGLHRTPHLRGSSVHSSALHRLSGEWWLVESGQHRGFSKHWTCREQHCSIFWRVRFGLRPFCKQEAAPLLPPGAGGGVTTFLWGFGQCSALVWSVLCSSWRVLASFLHKSKGFTTHCALQISLLYSTLTRWYAERRYLSSVLLRKRNR